MRRTAALAAIAFGLAAVVAVVTLSTGSRNSSPGRRSHHARRARRHYGRYRGRVPVLMYHLVEVPPPGAPFGELYVRPDTFGAQMAWLARHGYRGVTLARVVAAWRGRAALPRRPLVVTFDDGYRSDFTNAFPVLRRLGWPAVLDLTPATFKDPIGIRPGQVRSLLHAGWELASHTLRHLDLTTLHGWRLHHEVHGSRLVLERRFGVPVHDFAYPAGRYDPEVVHAVSEAGYRAALTTDPGLASRRRPLALARLRVLEEDGVRGLALKLRSG